MQHLAERRGQIQDMMPDGKGRVRLTYIIPTRGLIGFHAQFLMMTSGSGVMYHVFDHYGPVVTVAIQHRNRGVLIANGLAKRLDFHYLICKNAAKFLLARRSKFMKE